MERLGAGKGLVIAAGAGAVAGGVVWSVLALMPGSIALEAGLCALVVFAASFGAWEFARRICTADEARLKLNHGIFETSNEAIIITDSQNRIIDANPAFERITGFKKHQVLGKDPGVMKSGKHDREFYNSMWKDINTTGRWQGEIWDRRAGGEVFAKWLSISTLSDKSGRVVRYIGIFTDITEMKQAEEHREFLAHYDPLTRLPNRVLLADRLRQALKHSDRTGTMTAVLMIDLDRFKHINDTLGHPAGDELLKVISGRLLTCIRKSDTVARLGGDEFCVVLTDVAKEKIAASVAQKIVAAVDEPVKLGVYESHVSASVGIALYPNDGVKPAELIKNADIAMYHAKDSGRHAYRFFTDRMQSDADERLRAEGNLRLALERKELVLHYQPQVSLKTGKICGMEGLIRRQEENWLVPPAHFIPIAEETGLIIPIGQWTLRETCRQQRAWLDEGMPPLRAAVNISAIQFNMPSFVSEVKAALEEYRIEPRLLEVELTERVIMHQAEEVLQKIKELKDLGVYISIDDFGTGYSSLSYLKRFNVDKLKIDYAFVKDLSAGENSSGAAIVKAIISLAHSLGTEVIAEGVEKQEQLDMLRRWGCDEIQGFYFSFPLPPEKFKALVKSGKGL